MSTQIKDQKILILAIDGGGIRGIIPAQLLALLERDLSHSLYQTFDMYAGSSVGSFLALAVGGLHYRGEQLLEFFTRDNIDQIFKKSFFSWLSLFHSPKYQGDGKRTVLNKIFGDKKFLGLEKLVLITAYDFIDKALVVFKSDGGYDADYGPSMAEVADASSAAPTYFPTVKTSATSPRWLVDGGVAENNPSLAILTTALKKGYSIPNIRILSLGTGSSTPYKGEKNAIGEASQHWGELGWLRHGVIDNLMNGNMDEAEYTCTQLLKDNFYRIDYALTEAEDSMDNTSEANIQALLQTAQAWYQQHKKSLIKWLETP